MPYRNIFLAASLSLYSGLALAQPPLAPSANNDIVSVYQQALSNNADLAAARAQWQANLESVPQARSGLLPQASLNADWLDSESRSTTQAEGANRTSRSGMLYQANLSQPLFRADRWYQLKSAKAFSEQATLEYSKAEQDLILQSAEVYFAVLRAQDFLATVKAEQNAFARQLEQATERFDVGLSDKTDVLEAQASYDNAVATRQLAEQHVADAFDALETLTQRSYSALQGLRHNLPMLAPSPNNAEAWVNTVSTQNLALQASHFAVESANQRLRENKAGHLPTVDAVAGYQYGDNDRLGLINSHSPFAPVYGKHAHQRSISVQLTVPLYTGGYTQSKVREAYHQLDGAEQNRESLRRQVVKNTRDIFRSVNTDIAQVQARSQAISSHQSALEANEIGYEVGTRSIVDLLDAQRRLYAAVRDYNDARYNYIVDTLRLKHVAGTLNPDDLASLSSFLKPDYNPDKDFIPN